MWYSLYETTRNNSVHSPLPQASYLLLIFIQTFLPQLLLQLSDLLVFSVNIHLLSQQLHVVIKFMLTDLGDDIIITSYSFHSSVHTNSDEYRGLVSGKISVDKQIKSDILSY